MSLLLNDLTRLNQTQVADNLALLATMVQEAYPAASVQRGAVHDLVLLIAAVLTTNDQNLVTRAINSLSLQQINTDSTLVDSDAVTNLLTNYGLTLLPGAAASGEIEILMSAATLFTVPPGFEFVAQGLTYTTDAAYTARDDESLVTADTDRLIVEIDDGIYSFKVNAVCSTNGTTGNVTRGTQFTTTGPLPATVTGLQAATDFTGGRLEETIPQVMLRLAAGAGRKSVGNRFTTSALLLDAYPDIVAISQIGFGDPEMFRDQHTLWPGAMGGRCDLYIRSNQDLRSTVLTKSCVLVSKTAGIGTWQFSLGRDDVPGFYEVTKITQEGAINTQATGYPITSSTRGYDTSGDDFVPDITDAIEAAFSRYGTITIQFTDDYFDSTPITVGDARDYDVAVSHLDNIGEIQDLVNQRDEQWPAGDILVKTPVPCFVKIAITIEVDDPDAVDQDLIKASVASVVNRQRFSGTLSQAVIGSVANTLANGGITTEVVLDGRILQPDGTEVILVTTTNLVIPESPVDYVTANIVDFLTTIEDISIYFE